MKEVDRSIVKRIGVAFLILLTFFIGLGLLIFGVRDKEQVKVVETIIATPSATMNPSPTVVYRNPQVKPVTSSSQPTSIPVQTINNNTTIQQAPQQSQPTPQPIPTPVTASSPQPTPIICVLNICL